MAFRRYAAFGVDSGAWFLLFDLATRATWKIAPSLMSDAAGVSFFLASLAIFSLKDGIAGRSLGKWLFGLQVVREESMEAIGLRASLLRNLPIVAIWALWLLAGLATAFSPSIAALWIGVALLFHALMALQVRDGPRWGDWLAATRVIRKKYAHRVPFARRGELCIRCGYNLRGNISGVCPECGTEIVSE